MDINHLLECEQVERVRSQTASSSSARAAHGGRADGYQRQLDDYRSRAARLYSGSKAA